MVSFGGVLGRDSLGQFDFSVRLGLFRLCIMGLFVSGSTMVYGRYNELVNGFFPCFINQHSHHWGAHPVGVIFHGMFHGIY